MSNGLYSAIHEGQFVVCKWHKVLLKVSGEGQENILLFYRDTLLANSWQNKAK